MNATCYACDAKATGYANHNSQTKQACKRHAEPRLKAPKHLCIYCDSPVRAGGLDLNNAEVEQFAHQKCYKEFA